MQEESETDSHAESDRTEEAGEEAGIGECDDGRSGKLTLSILLQEKLITPGESVMSIDYLGQTFKGDLLPAGKIRYHSLELQRMFLGRITNPPLQVGGDRSGVQ